MKCYTSQVTFGGGCTATSYRFGLWGGRMHIVDVYVRQDGQGGELHLYPSSTPIAHRQIFNDTRHMFTRLMTLRLEGYRVPEAALNDVRARVGAAAAVAAEGG